MKSFIPKGFCIRQLNNLRDPISDLTLRNSKREISTGQVNKLSRTKIEDNVSNTKKRGNNVNPTLIGF